ncbi:Cys Met metabolism pyridoxal-phosphate-dependent protein, putative [Babesia ovata]|uniref:Cys Met metabolism pyridoxal-phosphate-dependent protein, putative n=1 Tax=Babesia ovata TaxID=189622 RepID=A0A2H6KA71_9APIC|nr:Cys Met metabolism pyridoxal-phosphate-dependent protein, putative [Babesia ovata]GBE59883.1 Cys Met metabolism pyridoxal-phosphate-dependent protein, putative [Babesia ovata]
MAVVIEQLPDGVTCRAGLLKPQLARRLVREYKDDGATSVFEAAPEAVLVDLPFRKLIFESRVVQRLFYEMETSDGPSYARKHISQNNLLLLDPIRLGACLNQRLDSARRQLLMRCFSVDVWLQFFKMVSLGIGEKIRKLCAWSTHPWLDDEFLYRLEDLQLELVRLKSRIAKHETSAYIGPDMANTIGDACSDVLTIAHKFDDDWGTVGETSRTVKKLCNYLSQHIAEVKRLFTEAAGGKDGMDVHASAEGGVGIKAVKLLEMSNGIANFVSQTALDLSVAKMKLLEKRSELCQKPGAFAMLEADVFKRGIQTSEYAHDDVMQMLILSHCIEAYGIREWCARFFIEIRTPAVRELRNNMALAGDGRIMKEESSPFFRTAGAVAPDVEDFVTLIPMRLARYICEMCDKN